jgi:hypothetical protein
MVDYIDNQEEIANQEEDRDSEEVDAEIVHSIAADSEMFDSTSMLDSTDATTEYEPAATITEIADVNTRGNSGEDYNHWLDEKMELSRV